MSTSQQRRRAAREADHDRPACDRCWSWLGLYELDERYCLGCREELRCQDDAHEAGERLGLYLRWTEIRDHGIQKAAEMAKQRRIGLDPEVMAAERARWLADE